MNSMLSRESPRPPCLLICHIHHTPHVTPIAPHHPCGPPRVLAALPRFTPAFAAHDFDSPCHRSAERYAPCLLAYRCQHVSTQTQSSDDDDEFIPTADDVEPVRPRSGRAAASRQVVRAQAAAMYEADLDAALQDDEDAPPASSRSRRTVKSRVQPPSYAEANSDAEYDYAPAQEKQQRKKAAKAAVVTVDEPPPDADVSIPPATADEPEVERVCLIYHRGIALTRCRMTRPLTSAQMAISLAQKAYCPTKSTKFCTGGSFDVTYGCNLNNIGSTAALQPGQSRLQGKKR